MTEIKSTLDIIMEKTKNLVFSEEEKKDVRRREWEGKIKGWIQRYNDSTVTLQTVQSEMEELGEENRPVIQAIIKKEILNNLAPGNDNTKLLIFLQKIGVVDIEPYEEALETFQQNLNVRKAEIAEAVIKQLEKSGITGSAVVPIATADPEWEIFYRQFQKNFRQTVMAINN